MFFKFIFRNQCSEIEPPSILIAWPVIQEADSEHRNEIKEDISDSCPGFCKGSFCHTFSHSISLRLWSTLAVCNGPGHIQLTLILYSVNSNAYP